MPRVAGFIILLFILVSIGHGSAWAQDFPGGGTSVDPVQKVTENTETALQILKGPVAKIGGAVVLLAGVAGLLRGRYQLAVSCAVAYTALMFLNRG